MKRNIRNKNRTFESCDTNKRLREKGQFRDGYAEK